MKGRRSNEHRVLKKGNMCGDNSAQHLRGGTAAESWGRFDHAGCGTARVGPNVPLSHFEKKHFAKRITVEELTARQEMGKDGALKGRQAPPKRLANERQAQSGREAKESVLLTRIYFANFPGARNSAELYVEAWNGRKKDPRPLRQIEWLIAAIGLAGIGDICAR